MKEHKYRAWHEVQKRMYSAKEMGADQLTLMVDGRGFANISGVDIKLSKIYDGKTMYPMQYTGKNDREGNEIYEGDILKYSSLKYSTSGLYLVEWSDDECRFICERQEPYNYISPCLWCECKILGNIYENPELLDVGDNEND